MVFDRQHLANCDEGSPVLTPSSKKVRSSAPLNIYRPPALRKRNEALEISSRDSSPDIVPVSKAERLRPAKQRRPDIQVYVPRAKRILATPEDNAKPPATLRSTPTERKKTSSTKRTGADKDSSQKPSKTRSLGDKSSCLQQLRTPDNERSDLSITSNYKNNTEKVGNSHETRDLHSGASCIRELSKTSEQRDSVLCREDDIETILDHSGREELGECVAEICSGCSVPVNETEILTDQCCQSEEVQREHGECVISECRTDFSSSLYGLYRENANVLVPESAKSVINFIEEVEDSCKICNRTLSLCRCNSSKLLNTVTESSEQSIRHLQSNLSDDVDSVVNSVVRGLGTSVGKQNIKECSSEQERSDLYILEDTWHKPVSEKINNKSEQNSVFHKVCLEQLEANNRGIANDVVEDIKRNSPVSVLEDNVLSDVLIISDNSSDAAEPIMSFESKESGDDNGNVTKDTSGSTIEETLVPATPYSENFGPTNPAPVRLNPDECTWEMMFDENGDCLDPKLIEEITNAVGSVKIEKPKSDYNGYQNKPEIILDPGDEFAHVIEIYNFPAAFKTEDLVTIFSPYKNGGFEIKWVDNTHALGIFSSSLVAAEVLAAEHPFVKTRPLREASHESRMKARRSAEFLQPYKVRPETCAALARRLVTGALGVKVNVTREEREAERRLLREAREKKRLAAKQRDEIWEGTFSAN